MLLEDCAEIPAPHYIREFAETSRCDDEGMNLSKARLAISKRLGSPAYSRIFAFEEDVPDTSRALQTMIHFRMWHKDLLLQALSPSLKFKYYTVHKIDRTAQMIGLIGLSYGGVRGATKVYRALLEANRKY